MNDSPADEKEGLASPEFRPPGDRRPPISGPAKKKPVVLRRPAGTFKPWVPPPPVPPGEEYFSLGARSSQMPPPPPIRHGDPRYLTYDEKGRLRTATCYRAPNFKDPVIQRPGKKRTDTP